MMLIGFMSTMMVSGALAAAPTLTLQSQTGSSSSSSSYSYTSMAFGTAFTGRILVVAGVSNLSGTPSQPTSVTIGGVSATIAVFATGSSNLGCWIAYAQVDTGTSGTVALTFSSSQTRNSVGVYSMTPPANQTPVSTSGPAGGADASRSVSLTLGTNEVALIVAIKGSTGVPTWTNATRDLSQDTSGQHNLSGGQYTSAGPKSRTITVNQCRAICAAVWH